MRVLPSLCLLSWSAALLASAYPIQPTGPVPIITMSDLARNFAQTINTVNQINSARRIREFVHDFALQQTRNYEARLLWRAQQLPRMRQFAAELKEDERLAGWVDDAVKLEDARPTESAGDSLELVDTQLTESVGDALEMETTTLLELMEEMVADSQMYYSPQLIETLLLKEREKVHNKTKRFRRSTEDQEPESESESEPESADGPAARLLGGPRLSGLERLAQVLRELQASMQTRLDLTNRLMDQLLDEQKLQGDDLTSIRDRLPANSAD